jgi:hypothetical protein
MPRNSTACDSDHFGNNLTASPLAVSCKACVIIPGRILPRLHASTPNINP